jgi:hypothetical protein
MVKFVNGGGKTMGNAGILQFRNWEIWKLKIIDFPISKSRNFPIKKA